MKLRLDEINVGHRARSDLGDIDALAQSIATLGQLQPVVVTPDRLLVAGARRIAACASLGLAEVEARVVVNLADATDLLRAERDENTCRKDFTPSEAARLGAALEALERPRAKERMRTGGAVGGQGGGKLPQASAKTRDVVGEAVGLSGRTYEKAAEVVRTAEDETLDEVIREVAEKAIAEMDRTGKVDPAHRKVRAAKAEAAAAPPGETEEERKARKERDRWEIDIAHFGRDASGLWTLLGRMQGGISGIVKYWNPELVVGFDFNPDLFTADGLHALADAVHKLAEEWEPVHG